MQYNNKWYPTTRQEIKQFVPENDKKVEVISCICPHAGWMYSGRVAGEVYSLISPADVYILLGPNHTGFGKRVSLFYEGEWEAPFGNVEVNAKISELILKKSEFVEKDFEAHIKEHSLEVQIPFLQYIAKKKFTIVPITIMSDSYQVCKDVGMSVASAIKDYKKVSPEEKVVIISSTDMTHYEQYNYAKKLDSLAIEKILELDDKGLYDTVVSYGITMCGVVPTVATIIASKALLATSSKLVKYQTSGDVSGDYEQVVGYAGLIVF